MLGHPPAPHESAQENVFYMDSFKPPVRSDVLLLRSGVRQLVQSQIFFFHMSETLTLIPNYSSLLCVLFISWYKIFLQFHFYYVSYCVIILKPVCMVDPRGP